jgi:TRAP-type C4-dicarboxylate transport system substrate-binding protein
MTRTWTIGLVVATAVVAGGCSLGGGSDKAGGANRSHAVVLALANHEEAGGDLEDFAREVKRLSKGSLRIEFKNRWRLREVDYERRTIEDVGDGKVDLGKIGARAFDTAGVRSLQPLVAPFAVDSYALQRRVLRSALPARMLRGVGRLDVVGIALLPGELRKPLGVSRALVAASDYRDATIAIRPSELSARTFRALGARTRAHLPEADISRFDGAEVALPEVEGSRYDDPARTLATNVNLWPRAVAIVMNRHAWDALSGDQREALHAAGRAAVDPTIKRLRGLENEGLGVLCNRRRLVFRSASAAQLRALRAATSPVTRGLRHDPATRDVAREIAAMRAEVEPEPAPSCGGVQGKRANRRSTRVDGLWRMDSTAAELARVAPEDADLPENWGRQTFALRAGRFAFTNENRQACIWGYGTYIVKDDVVEWRFEAGGGDSPTDSTNRPGEVFKYRWSRYRDRLTFRALKGAISPPGFHLNPWRLLEGRPSLSGLSSRCPPPRAATLQP